MLGVFLIATLATGAPTLDLVNEGTPVATIVLPDDADEVARYAAEELNLHLQQISGISLPVQPESAPSRRGAVEIHIGHTRESAELPRPGPRGFEIHATRRRLYLYGDDRPGLDETTTPDDLWDQVGTLNAVYDLLQDELGVRWLWPGKLGTYTPQATSVSIRRDLTISESPSLMQRHLRPVFTASAVHRYLRLYPWLDPEAIEQRSEEEWVWLRRMRMARDPLFHFPPGHAYDSWWDKYRLDHPDWFADRGDGQRDPTTRPATIKLCVSNPELPEAIVAQHLASRGSGTSAAIAENDGSWQGFCTGARCRAWDTGAETTKPFGLPAPSYSDRYAHFFHDVALVLKDKDPSGFAVAYAYGDYRDAPTAFSGLPDNLILGWVETTYPATAAQRNHWLTQWQGWRSAGEHRMFWRPNALLESGHGHPLVFGTPIVEDLQALAQQGAIATDFDRLVGHWATNGPTMYMLGRAHWDTSHAPAEFESEWYEAFGAGAPHIRALMTHWRAMSERWTTDRARNTRLQFSRNPTASWIRSVPTLYVEEDYTESRRHLAAALDALPAGPSPERDRVNWLLEATNHSELTRTTIQAFNQSWTRTWMPASLLESARALRRNRADLAVSWPVNLVFLTHAEIRSGDATGQRALDEVDQQPFTAIYRLPMRPMARFAEEDHWFRAGLGGITWSLNGIEWMRTHDWEPYDGPVWYRFEQWSPPDDAGAATHLYFSGASDAVTVWFGDQRMPAVDKRTRLLPLPPGWQDQDEVRVHVASGAGLTGAIWVVRLEDSSAPP